VTFGLGGAVAATILARKARAKATEISAWVWPVPMLGDRRPVVSDGWASPRRLADGSVRKHMGADIMYRRRSEADQAAEQPPGSPSGSRWYFMPEGTPALAVAPGIVRIAKDTPRGFTVVIRHAGGWTTYYTHLASLAVAAGQPIAAGQSIGLIGHDPSDSRHLRHLHFELWKGGKRSGAVDPTPYLAAWNRASSPGERLVRNGALAYRPIGDRGEPYPSWVRALKGRSGVYVIREGNETVYVGESHSDRLYETLTRHFQAWRRWKGFWKGQFAEGHDPGLTYDRGGVEVAVRETRPGDAIDEERRLIERLRPRDNLLGQPELEDAPF
jgi:hypothetical protein